MVEEIGEMVIFTEGQSQGLTFLEGRKISPGEKKSNPIDSSPLLKLFGSDLQFFQEGVSLLRVFSKLGFYNIEFLFQFLFERVGEKGIEGLFIFFGSSGLEFFEDFQDLLFGGGDFATAKQQ